MIRVLFICHGISIHALFAEGDLYHLVWSRPSLLFLSTPSSQRATADGLRHAVLIHISIHALFAEGDHAVSDSYGRILISIHALFAEGDAQLSAAQGELAAFLSTPSSQRATASLRQGRGWKTISIHALFAEGDLLNEV